MSRTSTLGLLAGLRRHLRAATWSLSTLVAVLAAVLLAAPTAFTALTTQEARTALDSGKTSGRYLIGRLPTDSPDTGPSADRAPRSYDATSAGLYGGYADRLADLRATFPPLVRASTGQAHWAITIAGILLSPADQGATPRAALTQLSLKVDPEARQQVDLVDGSWPSDTKGGPVPVALSLASARALGWRVGQVRKGHVLTGTWRPRDPGADYWSLNPSTVKPQVNDSGNTRAVVTGMAFTSPARWTESAPVASSGGTQIWYPFDLSAVDGSTLDRLVPQLRQVTARTPSATSDTSFTLAVAGLPELEAAQDRVASARSVLTLAAVGPVGATAMVLVLAVRAFASRRRTTVGLLANRGASRAWLRRVLALEGLLIGVPAGALALLVTWLVVGAPTKTGVVLAAPVVLLPAVLLPCTPIRTAMRPERADVGGRHGWRHRPLLEAAVVLLAAVSAYLLLSAGLGASGGQVDALVVATPLLLSGAACVLVLRLYPPPLRLLAGRLGRRRSTIGWIGALRFLRDPGAPVVPVLTVLLAVAVSVFSVATLATIAHGTKQTALAQTGAQLRVDGPVISDATYARVEAVPGVAAAARLQDVGRTMVFVEGTIPRPVEVWRTDLAALADVQRGVRGGLPRAAANGDVVLPHALDQPGAKVRIGPSIDDLDQVRVGGTSRGVAGIADGDDWLLADVSAPSRTTYTPRTLLISLDPGADAAAVARNIDRLTRSGGTITSADRAVLALQDEPVSRGLRTFLLLAVAIVALAGIAAVTLSLAMGAAARVRHLAVLRVLGVPASRRRWYAVWELVPSLSVTVVVGSALGLGLALTVHAVVDLAPFTGDAAQPPLVLPGGWLALLLVGFVVFVALAMAAGVWVAGRRNPAESIKMDADAE